jgi:hypothetical protein
MPTPIARGIRQIDIEIDEHRSWQMGCLVVVAAGATQHRPADIGHIDIGQVVQQPLPVDERATEQRPGVQRVDRITADRG